MKKPCSMSIRPHMQESRESLKKTLCVVCVLLAMFRNRKWLFWDLPISVRKSTNIGLQVLIIQCLLIEKQDAGMLTSNAKSSSPTLSHALQQVKAARIEVICQGVSSAPHFLLAKAPRVQLSTFSPISLSPIHLADSLYQCPADCFKDILLEQAGNSHWNKLAFLQHIKCHICSVGAWKYFTWYQWGQRNAG